MLQNRSAETKICKKKQSYLFYLQNFPAIVFQKCVVFMMLVNVA